MEYEYDAWRVVHWSECNGKNVSKTYTKSELYSYIKYYEEGATGNASYDREIDRIKSSVGSCVVFGFGPEEPEKKGDEYVKPWKYYAKLFINDIPAKGPAIVCIDNGISLVQFDANIETSNAP